MALQLRHRLLMVDDDANIRELIAILFNLHNYEVAVAGNGIEALRMLRRTKPHLLVADLQMPLMDGFELLRIIRFRFPDIGVIAISGAFEGYGIPCGVLADAFFAKGTYSPAELLDRADDLAARFPLRARPEESPLATVWIPSGDRQSLWIACTDCLRSFSIESSSMPELTGRHNVSCPFCSATVEFLLGPDVMKDLKLVA